MDEAHPDLSGLADVVDVSRGVGMVARHAGRLEKWRHVMQPNLVKNIEQGLALRATDVARAEVTRTQLWERAAEFFDTYDLVVTPTAAVEPFAVETMYPPNINGVPMATYIQWVLLTYAFTILGVPAISIPCGFSRNGLPVGLQIAGRWRDETTVLRAAAAFEQAAAWADKTPSD
ncbi:MAG TPA: amidase family protein [Methylomirabilota bacterium]|nr:amidase family protein [Methylomirabilota bacterium]